jgi:dephospho-CoA kinase
MLEKKGVLGIDADDLVHRALQRGTKGYQKICQNYGEDYLKSSGEIDRAKLAATIFQDKEALKLLESILHPLVITSFKQILRISRLPIIVIEAIKLLESELVTMCDNIWTVHIHENEQIIRLMQSRGLSETQIKERLAHQSSSEEKMQRSDTVVYNDQALAKTWKDVNHSWKTLLIKDPIFHKAVKQYQKLYSRTESGVRRLTPEDAYQKTERIKQYFSSIKPSLSETIFAIETPEKICEGNVFNALCTLHFLASETGNHANFAIWSSENLIAQIYYLPYSEDGSTESSASALINRIEIDARLRLCDTSIVYVSKGNHSLNNFLNNRGYQPKKTGTLKSYQRDILKRNLLSEYNLFIKSLE